MWLFPSRTHTTRDSRVNLLCGWNPLFGWICRHLKKYRTDRPLVRSLSGTLLSEIKLSLESPPRLPPFYVAQLERHGIKDAALSAISPHLVKLLE